MNKMLIVGVAALLGGAVRADGLPEIVDGSVTMSQNPGTRAVTIGYTLANGPAIVTVDVFTNCVGDAFGVSVGGNNLWNVQVGPWPDSNGAQQRLAGLRALYPHAFVVGGD